MLARDGPGGDRCAGLRAFRDGYNVPVVTFDVLESKALPAQALPQRDKVVTSRTTGPRHDQMAVVVGVIAVEIALRGEALLEP